MISSTLAAASNHHRGRYASPALAAPATPLWTCLELKNLIFEIIYTTKNILTRFIGHGMMKTKISSANIAK